MSPGSPNRSRGIYVAHELDPVIDSAELQLLFELRNTSILRVISHWTFQMGASNTAVVSGTIRYEFKTLAYDPFSGNGMFKLVSDFGL